MPFCCFAASQLMSRSPPTQQHKNLGGTKAALRPPKHLRIGWFGYLGGLGRDCARLDHRGELLPLMQLEPNPWDPRFDSETPSAF